MDQRRRERYLDRSFLFCLPIENAPTQCYNKLCMHPIILPRKEFKYMAKNQPMTPPAGDEIFLLKMGEMVLKGLNRRTFEERLMGNARRRLEKFGKFRIYSRQSITYIEPKTEDCDMDGAFETLTRLFGVVGLSRRSEERR